MQNQGKHQAGARRESAKKELKAKRGIDVARGPHHRQNQERHRFFIFSIYFLNFYSNPSWNFEVRTKV
jgi:hypothetical protein